MIQFVRSTLLINAPVEYLDLECQSTPGICVCVACAFGGAYVFARVCDTSVVCTAVVEDSWEVFRVHASRASEAFASEREGEGECGAYQELNQRRGPVAPDAAFLAHVLASLAFQVGRIAQVD